MKRVELENIINEINQKIGSVDDFVKKVMNATQILTNAQNQVADLTSKSQQSTDLLVKVQAQKTEVETWSDNLKKASDEAIAYGHLIAQQKEEYEKLKNNFSDLKQGYLELEQSAKDQLGIVSMESLANAFATEAVKLKESTDKWFRRIFWISVVLMLAVLGVAIWQVIHEKTLLKFSFAIKLPIITPIIYYLYFTISQYKREKRLFEEYSFKASIARSFEAYRKVLNEEKENEHDPLKKNELIVNTIKEVYSSPMKNIADNQDKEDKDNELQNKGFDLLNKIIEYGDKLKSLLTK